MATVTHEDVIAPPTCPVCSSEGTVVFRRDLEDFEYRIDAANHEMWRCPHCASEFVHPLPPEHELVQFYPPEYHCYNEDHGLLARILVDIRARVRGKYYRSLAPNANAALFDIGTGDCRHFDELRRFCDMKFSGIEIQPEMVQRARARGYDLLEGTLETADISAHEGQYDIVSMNHVLEHVLNPGEVLRRCFRLLVPGGVVVGQLPTVDCWERQVFGRYWGGYHFPRHLQLFSRESLRFLLASSGFKNVEVTSALHIQGAISLQNLLVGRGARLRLHYGRSRWFSTFMLAVMPFEVLAAVCRRSGIVDFQARKPAETR